MLNSYNSEQNTLTKFKMLCVKIRIKFWNFCWYKTQYIKEGWKIGVDFYQQPVQPLYILVPGESAGKVRFSDTLKINTYLAQCERKIGLMLQ